ncbi:MAG: hypothetical protein DYG96_04400 [Chlorobi bacterium CHB2]|nr:hypothetical protein [Chlorobi bacterium CHB2]
MLLAGGVCIAYCARSGNAMQQSSNADSHSLALVACLMIPPNRLKWLTCIVEAEKINLMICVIVRLFCGMLLIMMLGMDYPRPR